MDVVMDLTARAVAFISLIQDMSYSQDPRAKQRAMEAVVLLDQSVGFESQLTQALQPKSCGSSHSDLSRQRAGDRFRGRAAELRRINGCRLLEEEQEWQAWIRQTLDLLHWLRHYETDLNQKLSFFRMESEMVKVKLASPWVEVKPLEENKTAGKDQPVEEKENRDPYPAPQQWRVAIRHVLHNSPDSRLGLAKALDCLPVLILLAYYGENPSPEQQKEFRTNWKKDQLVEKLLESDENLLQNLRERNIPLPFEMVYRQELKEIKERRRKQQQSSPVKDQDPLQQAATLKLRGLAFSGGGIRSATFNLGILQGLAKAGLLPTFDYLSTVSGGGYIGAWFAAWIKREGLLVKVQDRLNPDKSLDPRGEEVRPIRWLRMFSNYLAPDTSIISLDSWTMGMTWLRNTMLNQAIILLLLCTILCFGFCGFLIWKDHLWSATIDAWIVHAIISALLILGGILAGWGMRSYHRQLDRLNPISSDQKHSGKKRPKPFKKNVSGLAKKIESKVTWGLLFLGLATSFLVSSWFFAIADTNYHSEISDRFFFLLPVAAIGAVSLLMVAWLGKYNAGLPDYKPGQKTLAKILLGIFSILAAVFGVLLLALAWGWIQEFACSSKWGEPWKNLKEDFKLTGLFRTREFNERVAFILGIPLIMEVLSLTVVMRMALLGKYFPDGRREWWGRLGGLVHLFVVGWVLLTGSCLLGYKLLQAAPAYVPATTSIWAILVGLAVRLASGSATPAQEKSPLTILQKGQDLLVRLAPYLFIIGVLVLASLIITWALQFTWFGWVIPDEENLLRRAALLMLTFGILTGILAWRVGVNEFSMHHFYRNRLMRGYLAATRRNMERKRSANAFTGFDEEDDLKLGLLRTDEGYDGPYPIINTTLNASQVTDLDRRDRQGESFVFTPLYCGFDISRNRANPNLAEKSNEYAFRPTEVYAYMPRKKKAGKPKSNTIKSGQTPPNSLPINSSETVATEIVNWEGEKMEMGGPEISTAMAISGAAANPNQGAHSSAATAFLMTVFNARLGWWIGNPLGINWQESDPKSGLAYIVYDLIGKTDTRRDFVCLSDGGHFDNMGLYELVRRRVRVIVLGDAEQDQLFNCEGLANAIRRCRVDFGVEIDIDISPITERDEKTRHSKCHCAIGTILYPEDIEGEPSGRLIYLKSSLTGTETVDVREYAMGNEDFPHQSTSDQFFSEDQFESYRKLGLHVMESALSNPVVQELLQVPVPNPIAHRIKVR